MATPREGRAPAAGAVLERRPRLEAERLEEYISRIVDEAPALSSQAQRDRLALLLRGGGPHGDTAA